MKPGDKLTKEDQGKTVTRRILRVWKYEVEYLETSTETRAKRVRTCTDLEWARWAKDAI